MKHWHECSQTDSWPRAGVPRVFDRIYAGVLAKIKEAGGVKALLYSWGFRRKAYFLAQGARHYEVRIEMGHVQF